MATWDELEHEEDSEKYEEQDNRALMTLTYWEAESKSDSDSESEEKDEVFSKLSHSDLITFVQELMGMCQEKSKHMKILKMQYDLLKDELKYVQNKN